MNRSRFLPSILAALFVAGAVVQSASCALDTNGSNQTTEPPTPCNTLIDCDDDNACTVDSCGADKLCKHEAVADGPLAGQIAGDCKRIDCASGAPVTVDDSADVLDDNEPCTNDTCSGGTPQNTPRADGEACQRGTLSGVCQASECQISCGPSQPCDDNNACTEEYCNAASSTCVYTNLDGIPTPNAPQTAEDCKAKFCVNGIDSVVNDDGDLPVDDNPCTYDVCAGGVPTNPPVEAAIYCMAGQPDVCDGNGACVECTLPEHCTGITETDCTKRDCVANKCVPKYLDQNTTASLQEAGNCQKNVCNGVDGGTISVADNSDVPNDGNPCTTDTCNSGAPKYTDVAQGTNCGGTNVCNATGDCVGCNAPTDCQGTDDFCKQRTCTNNICGWSYTANNMPLPMGSQIAMDCKVIVCNGNGGTKTIADTNDLPDDGKQCTKNQCTMAGTPSFPAEAQYTSCSESGGTVCDGSGTCKKANGTTVAGSSECASGNRVDGVCCSTSSCSACNSCNLNGMGTCSPVAKGMEDGASCSGTKSCNGSGQCLNDDGETCSMAGNCVSNFCVDSRCCENGCGGTCQACNVPMNLGKCVDVPSGQDDGACSGLSSCDGAGTCKGDVGQNCGAAGDCLSGFCADGVCCNEACTGTCKACNLAMKGTCSNIDLGQDDPTAAVTCTAGGYSCNGMGACAKDQGQTCTMGSQCATGFCVNMVCCATACNGAGQACDASGTCKKANGQTCADGMECANGFCVDGVCCGTGCTATCYTCNGAMPGTCTPFSTKVTADNYPAGACTGNNSCDDAGNCLLANGQTCGAGTDCASGNCVNNMGNKTCQP